MQNTATSFLSRWYENHAFQIKWSPDCKILKCNKGDNTDGSNNYSHTEIRMLIQSFDIKSLVKKKKTIRTQFGLVPKTEVVRK